MGPFGGDVRSLLQDSWNASRVYLGTSNGSIFRSGDGGRTWTRLSPGIGPFKYVIDTLVQHPKQADHVYAGAWDLHSDGGGLFETVDAGLTWRRMMLPQPNIAVRGFAICRAHPERMLVGTLAGVFVSDDGGKTWRNVGGSMLEKAESVAIDPLDYRILYVGTWRLAYRSNDFGKTWTRLERGMPLDSDVFSISVSLQNPEVVYASACSGIYRSTNRAQTWNRLRVVPDRFTIRAHLVVMDPMDARVVYGGTTEGLFVSRNEGQSWVRLTSKDVVVNAIQIDPSDNRRILIGTEYQGVMLSEDGGLRWKESNAGFIHKQVSWIAPDTTSGSLVAGVQSGGGGLYRYADKDRSWSTSQIGPGMRVLSFLVLPEEHGKLAGTVEGLYWQRDDSSEWIKLSGVIARRTVHALCLDLSRLVVYAGTDQGIYRAPVDTLKFRIPPGSRLSPKTWSLATSRANPSLVYAGTSLGILRSWDRGTTWSIVSAYGLPERTVIETLATSPSREGHLFAGTSVGLFESQNGGIHWRRVSDERMEGGVSAVLFLDDSGRHILSATKRPGALFYSSDAGASWDLVPISQFDAVVYCLVRDPVRPSLVYAGTQSDGVYALSLQF